MHTYRVGARKKKRDLAYLSSAHPAAGQIGVSALFFFFFRVFIFSRWHFLGVPYAHTYQSIMFARYYYFYGGGGSSFGSQIRTCFQIKSLDTND